MSESKAPDPLPQKAVESFKKHYPHIARNTLALQEFRWAPIINNIKGDLDLISAEFTLYGRVNIESSLRNWASHLDLQQQQLVIVYGFGLGYPVKALQSWLDADPSRRLVFLEDDLEIFYHALKVPGIEAIFENKQVELNYVLVSNLIMVEFYKKIFEKHLFKKINYTGIPSYQSNKTEFFNNQKFNFDYANYQMMVMTGEMFDLGKDFYDNFWDNVFKIPQSSLLSGLKGGLKNIPAIVVGAGPSIIKNIDQLKSLKDKALIISGGTAVNVLNSHGIDPHLILGLDPFDSCFTRAISYTSFETPFIYKARYHKVSFDEITAPKILLNGGLNYETESWLMNELDIPQENIDLGTNVLNASVQLAEFFGCSPIVTVGIDLAYSNEESYGSGIKAHALMPDSFKSRSKGEEVILFRDIYDNPITTLLKWINESVWYENFKSKHPDLNIINCTEGGIGFKGILNRPLKEVAEEFITKPHDIMGALHVLQENSGTDVSSQQVIALLDKLLESLKLIRTKFEVLYNKNPSVFEVGDLSDLNDKDKKEAEELLEDVKDELAWKHLIKQFDKFYVAYMTPMSTEERKLSPLVKAYSGGRLAFISHAVLLYLDQLKPVIDQNKNPHLEVVAHKPTLIDENHELVKCNWKEGKKEGPYTLWYKNGQLYANLSYKEGELDGLQQYYTSKGALKSEINYSKGVLDGFVTMYWPSGQKKRQLFFRKGKREEFDRAWREDGSIHFEAQYENDRPIETARLWNKANVLIQEVVYEADGKYIIKQLDTSGQLTPLDEHHNESYLSFVSRNTQNLTQSLDKIIKALEGAIFALSLSDHKGILGEDMPKLKENMVLLRSLGENLNALSIAKMADVNKEGQKEMEKILGRDLNLLSEQMRVMTQQLSFQIEEARKKIKSRPGEET